MEHLRVPKYSSLFATNIEARADVTVRVRRVVVQVPVPEAIIGTTVVA